ncbi:inner-membrane translocator [Roseivivax marinus]|jgi:branched-chain amino acid transport system permease protein|uniref:Inner-membrane translocator n=1 Tax=Roseivivax marinus TaxID=1379903 RepID=W4HHM5_9RHOB|nr:branched-chain amino acid ABC transporter permease [Roseivivax marinus]ETW11883.1 inner-membrane translocator [Roseivivax marinus]UMA63956.1 branched-chain amino acid ABC transporter permease [Roseivivax marinus]SEK39329.1 amino acid/amide ABC transporter membrane protein 1, HAAT family [Roseivivax marinus]
MTNLFVLQLLNGVQLGVLLFLIAAGLTLVFGIMDVVNLAHGVLYMVGAYFVATFASLTGSFWWGLLLMLPAAVAVGLILELVVIRRLYTRSHLDQVLATFGLVMIANETVKIVWGVSPLSVPTPEILSGSVPLMGPLQYPVYRIAIIVAGLAVAGALYLVINHTRIGMLLRAGATNRAMVSALGVDIGKLFAIVFTLGAVLACLAGALVAPILSVDTGMGESVLILTFVVVVIGGIGSIKGAFLGALLVAIVDTLGGVFGPILLRSVLDPSAAGQAGRMLAPMLVYILMAAILCAKPAGLFGGRG